MKISFLSDALFPPRCARCDTIPEQRRALCNECRPLLLVPDNPLKSCDICFFTPERCICSGHQLVSKLSASFYYEDDAARAVFRLKFRARRDIAKYIASVMYESLTQRNMLETTDIITFIPMSPFAKFRRGYNQSELIAKHIAALSGKPCEPLLYKITATDKQHTLAGIQRTGNLLGVFEPRKEYESRIRDSRILVVDDVRTTGSTFNEIAKTLLIFGAAEVYAAAFTVRKKEKKH